MLRQRWIVIAAAIVAGLILVTALPAQEAAPETAAQPATQAAATEAAESAADPAATPATDAAAPTGGEARPEKASQELEAQADAKHEWLMQIFGWGMVPLWICSIILVALLFERHRALKLSRIIDAAMIEQVADLVGQLKIDEAQQVSARSSTVLGQAWAQALHEFQLGGTNLAETLTNSTVLAFKPLKRNLTALATVGVVSPLFGLLGTVLGMIITFGQIAATGGADKAELAGGIGLALFTTAGGLIVAIPAILGNRYFVAYVTTIAERAEEAISRINYRYSHAQARAQSADASAAAQ
ncbi:MAG: MotA/TolQ/ExbB proton channel family protein [Planctomycetes bacterium]|nr:MotA/TolQ/ExbB proton channel family protein [Planctomycetota bacterium]